MATLPQLIEEDILEIEAALQELLDRTEAKAALLADTGGFLIASLGDSGAMDFTTIAALASGSFMASQSIANLIQEKNFNSIYQQGAEQSLFAISVGEQNLLIVVFSSNVAVGLVKYYAVPAAQRIDAQLVVSQERYPGTGFDLSELNLADPSSLFKRREDPL